MLWLTSWHAMHAKWSYIVTLQFRICWIVCGSVTASLLCIRDYVNAIPIVTVVLLPGQAT